MFQRKHSLCCRMQVEFLYSPVQELRNVKRIFGRTGNLMHPTELAELFAGFSENAEDVSVQIHFVDPARVGIGSVENLFGPGSNADGPRSADVGPLFEKIPVIIEDLYPVIFPVARVLIALRVRSNGVYGVKFSRFSPSLAPGLYPVTVFVILHDARIAVSVRKKTVTGGIPGDVGRAVEKPLRENGKIGIGRRRRSTRRRGRSFNR